MLDFLSAFRIHNDRSRLPQSAGLVRFFSPKEILNFLGFPRNFLLPKDMDLKHRYKVVGNSIAVTVASQLLRLLLYGEGAERLNSLEEAPPRSQEEGGQGAASASPQSNGSAPSKLSGRSSASSTSAGLGSVASSPSVSSPKEWLGGFAGFFQPRPYPKPSATAPSMLKEAFRQRGGVVKERDGFEVFYGMERPERNERPSGAKTARGRKSVDLRDGFDKFYGIPSVAAEDSSSSPKRSRELTSAHISIQSSDALQFAWDRGAAMRLISFWVLPLLAVAEGWFQQNCFELLKEPLSDAPFTKAEIARLIQHFSENFDVNRTGAIIASPGATPALGPGPVGGYRYHWIRDGALSMSAFLQAADLYDLPAIETETIFLQYVDWVELLHERGSSTMDEPKWNIEKAEPYALGWCRPQTDGPPLRARSLMQAGRLWRKYGGKLWDLAKKDLDWLIAKQEDGTRNLNKETCDLWEETTGNDFFWNKAVTEAALLEGIQHSQEVGDATRAQAYLEALQEDVGDVTERHQFWSFFRGKYLTECPSSRAGASCEKYRKQIDGAVILGLVHGRTMTPTNASRSSVPLPTDLLVAETVMAYNKEFCSLYAVNRAESQGNQLPGVLYGRYAADEYGAKDGGNPWVLITAALANLLYQAAETTSATPLTHQELAAWKAALNGGSEFNGSPRAFLAAGDSVLMRLRNHISKDDFHLFEQIDRSSGQQYNAKDLTWSYAELLNALVTRHSAAAKVAAAGSGAPVDVVVL
eukprot:s1280_g13.t1